MQTGFDFTGLRGELGERYDEFVQQWAELQRVLSSRGRGALEAGRMLVSFEAAYGSEWLWKVLALSKAPGIPRAKMLMNAHHILRDTELTDAQLAVLDSIIYTRMQQERRLQALQMLVAGRATQEIDDFIDATRPPPGPAIPPQPKVTEEDVRLHYASELRRRGYLIESAESKTSDGGRVDILAGKTGRRPIIVECKAILDRARLIEALGQLTLYSQTYTGRDWQIAYWQLDDSAVPIVEACKNICRFVKVSLTTEFGLVAIGKKPKV